MKDRIQRILDEKKMTPSHFADVVGLNRPAVSHILNGRNNPGLEALQRILATFPDINAAWLISGTGPMYNLPQKDGQLPFIFDDNAEFPTDVKDTHEYPKENALKTPLKDTKVEDIQNIKLNITPSVHVKKIAVFYTDNTYEEFIPSDKD